MHCRIRRALSARNRPTSRRRYRLAQDVLKGNYRWLEDGILLPEQRSSRD